MMVLTRTNQRAHTHMDTQEIKPSTELRLNGIYWMKGKAAEWRLRAFDLDEKWVRLMSAHGSQLTCSMELFDGTFTDKKEPVNLFEE